MGEYLEPTRKKMYLNPDKLVPVLDELREKGKTIVFGNGCFELLHVGHVRYLYGARMLGDILIVAVNTDDCIARIKPDRKPVNPDVERMELIAALESVSFVVPLREDTPERLLKLFKPDIHTKGTDYKIEDIPERHIVESYGGVVKTVGDPKNHSTTNMLRELKKEE